MKILVNDGISKSGIDMLEAAGHEVLLVRVAQDQLVNYINNHHIDVLLVRSATKVGKAIIENCPGLKIIGRAGVGLDNIDVAYAREKGIIVINTPTASASSVAELAFAHLLSGARFLHHSNRSMPLEGDSKFKELKKEFSAGTELRGKTLGLIGFGNIAQEMAKLALGFGMKIIVHRQKQIETNSLTIHFFDGQEVSFTIPNLSFEEVLKNSDFISVHVPSKAGTLIDNNAFSKMKDGVGIINTARGGVIDEAHLLTAIESGKVKFAALDVFENEPKPHIQILMNEQISLSPHIGGSTVEAQNRIGVELAKQIIEIEKTLKSD